MVDFIEEKASRIDPQGGSPAVCGSVGKSSIALPLIMRRAVQARNRFCKSQPADLQWKAQLLRPLDAGFLPFTQRIRPLAGFPKKAVLQGHSPAKFETLTSRHFDTHSISQDGDMTAVTILDPGDMIEIECLRTIRLKKH